MVVRDKEKVEHILELSKKENQQDHMILDFELTFSIQHTIHKAASITYPV